MPIDLVDLERYEEPAEARAPAAREDLELFPGERLESDLVEITPWLRSDVNKLGVLEQKRREIAYVFGVWKFLLAARARVCVCACVCVC